MLLTLLAIAALLTTACVTCFVLGRSLGQSQAMVNAIDAQNKQMLEEQQKLLEKRLGNFGKRQ